MVEMMVASTIAQWVEELVVRLVAMSVGKMVEMVASSVRVMVEMMVALSVE